MTYEYRLVPWTDNHSYMEGKLQTLGEAGFRVVATVEDRFLIMERASRVPTEPPLTRGLALKMPGPRS